MGFLLFFFLRVRNDVEKRPKISVVYSINSHKDTGQKSQWVFEWSVVNICLNSLPRHGSDSKLRSKRGLTLNSRSFRLPWVSQTPNHLHHINWRAFLAILLVCRSEIPKIIQVRQKIPIDKYKIFVGSRTMTQYPLRLMNYTLQSIPAHSTQRIVQEQQ